MDNEKDSVAESVVETSEKELKPKKSKKKLLIVLGVIAVVLVSVVIGGWTWHNSPTFCNAFCHSPMDSYVEGYFSDDVTWLAATHRVAGEECLDCHKATIGEMVNEAIAWVSGNYTDPLPMTKIGTREFCLACHDYQDAIAATVNYNGSSRNPHDSHYGDSIECYSCHRGHRESVMFCNSCHPDISGPPTWTS